MCLHHVQVDLVCPNEPNLQFLRSKQHSSTGTKRRCRRGSYGCKDQLLINKMILENCRCCKKLSAAWIDYRKAFDSVPHSWILKTLEIYKVSPVVVNFLKHSMEMWNTTRYLNDTRGTAISNRLNIRRGISPFLFCLSLILLTHKLNNRSYGYKLDKDIQSPTLRGRSLTLCEKSQ